MAKLLQVDGAELYKNLLKPRIKVGNEFVNQGRNKDQVSAQDENKTRLVSKAKTKTGCWLIDYIKNISHRCASSR